MLQAGGPLLITANHPNALMDAIIIGALFHKPVHYLTRGDVFNKPWKRKLLEQLNMVPIYRMRDGIQNLHLNEYAFNKSHAILKNGGIVLIFIEGACIHTHELQPFKKGAARIAANCWKDNILLHVMPITIRYHSLFRFGKQVKINAAPPLSKEQLFFDSDDAKNYMHFNRVLFSLLEQQLKEKPVEQVQPSIFLVLLSNIAQFIHLPLYYPVKKFVSNKTKGNEFYDSVLFALLFVLYPFYAASVSLLLFIITNNIAVSIIVFFLLPTIAWFTVKNKKQKA